MQRRARSLLNQIHKWIGLSIGGIFVLLGLTGSFLVFYPEIDLLLHPKLRTNSAPDSISINKVVAVLRQAEPERDESWRIEIPKNEAVPIAARYMSPVETREKAFAPLMVTIDPMTMEVTSARFWGDYFVTWVYDLHYTLLLDQRGRTILGICALILLGLFVSGLFLWWPASGRWAASLRMKSGAGNIRRVYDLHTKPAVYSLPFILTLVVTGLILEVPKWFEPVIEQVSSLTTSFNGQIPSNFSNSIISGDEAVKIAVGQFPNAYLRWVETPAVGYPVWRIRLYQAGEPSERFPKTNVWIHANTGEILAIRDPKINSGGDTLMDWLHPLHNGEAFGLTGRIIVFICGFLPLLAFTTGYLRWRHKAAARGAAK